jgi:thiosulfate dehydrogenase
MKKGITICVLLAIAVTAVIIAVIPDTKKVNAAALTVIDDRYLWEAPDTIHIPHTKEGDLIRYGRQLVAQTAYYLGPKGVVAAISNGMNCQNCHLDAGTKPWGNNYGSVSSIYPVFRARSGSMESIEKRINDCLQRSLNGRPLDGSSREMRAIIAYMHWLGKDVPKGKKVVGSGITSLAYLDRPADSALGSIVYAQKCQRCHGADGSGQADSVPGTGYRYPPLWGSNSYNVGAGIYRLSRLAGYVKDNMPFGVRHDSTELTDEEAWDVAAFVNSQQRPLKDLSGDWPDIKTKPVDHPFGPFADSFPERQHKYGPFTAMKNKK